MEKTLVDFEQAERASVRDINDVLAVDQEFPITNLNSSNSFFRKTKRGRVRRVQTNPEDCTRSSVAHSAGSPR